jgi:hypothetical protein
MTGKSVQSLCGAALYRFFWRAASRRAMSARLFEEFDPSLSIFAQAFAQTDGSIEISSLRSAMRFDGLTQALRRINLGEYQRICPIQRTFL